VKDVFVKRWLIRYILAGPGSEHVQLPASCCMRQRLPSVNPSTAKGRATQVPRLWHRNSLCTRMDSRRSRPRCAHVPPRLAGFALTLEMHYPRRSKYPRPPRPRSAERCLECVRTSIRFLWEPLFGSLAKPENDHRGVLGSPIPLFRPPFGHWENRSIPIY
jgi:hypothetical protein